MADSSLTPRSARTSSRELAELLRAGIDAGDFASGELLPSYRELAEAHGVAINTAQAAVRILEQSARVRIRKGIGAEVLPLGNESSPAFHLAEVGQELAAALEEFHSIGARQAELEKRLGRILDQVRQAERVQRPVS